MRGRSIDFEYLGSEILKTLGQADSPVSALGINFTINNKLDRIIELNIVKNHLDKLVEKKKVIKKVNDKTAFYRLRAKK